MKTPIAIFALLFFILLSACNNPIVIPANVAVTLPANQDFIVSATVPVTPDQITNTAVPENTSTVTPTITPSVTPSQTPTQTLQPTRKSPYPAAQGTPIVDMGFQPIGIDNLTQIQMVFNALVSNPRHAVASTDGQKLFLSTSNGLFLFDRLGKQLAYWPNIFTTDLACESCISTNKDGSRVAVMTRKAGSWEAQVYSIAGDQAALLFALPVEPGFLGVSNEASIAISPDNAYLAFKAGAGTLRVLNLETKLQVLGYDRAVTGITFTPDGANFIIHGGQEMLLYNVSTWKAPANLLLPREDTPYAFSADGKLLAIALPTKMRVYSVEKFKMLREINVPPSNADLREWQIVFQADNTLSGYAIRWDASHTNATVETGKWDVATGNVLAFDTSVSASPDALSWLWGAALTLPSTRGQLEAGVSTYQSFRFIADGMLLVNSPHSACWLKLLTAESTCFKDPDHIVFASDGTTFTEVLAANDTSLVDRGGNTAILTGPYQIAAINRTGDWALIDTGSGTDLYTKGKKLPQESVKGVLQGFAENSKQIVLSTLEKENSFTITLIDKTTGDAIYQKPDNFLYKPILMTADGTIYYMQNELGAIRQF